MAAQSESSFGESRERPPSFRGGDSTSRRVLEDVLRQTAALYSVEQASDPADLEALRQVARKFPGAPFGFEPILVEMVRTMLRRQLKSAWQSEEQLTIVAERVARTLHENPESHDRLNDLWNRLSGVT